MAQSKPENSRPRKTFEELARDLECDESEERFEEAVKKVAKTPPAKKDQK